jgi:predicted component of type VI protein secretion system
MPFLELDEEIREIMADTTVGSGSQAAWRVPNKDLAARHFTIKVNGPNDVRVVPATDRSVVVIRGRQIPAEGVQLSSGDVISAGAAEFVYLSDRDAARGPARPAGAGEAYVVDATSRKAYHLKKRTVQIGRDAASGIVLRDPTVSRHHADIRAEAGGYVLYSSGSSGTSLNDQPHQTPRLLDEGDRIRIGSALLTFTRALPQGVEVVEPSEAQEDDLSRRTTRYEQEAIATGQSPRYETRSGSPVKLVVIIFVVLALAAAAFWMMR